MLITVWIDNYCMSNVSFSSGRITRRICRARLQRVDRLYRTYIDLYRNSFSSIKLGFVLYDKHLHFLHRLCRTELMINLSVKDIPEICYKRHSLYIFQHPLYNKVCELSSRNGFEELLWGSDEIESFFSVHSAVWQCTFGSTRRCSLLIRIILKNMQEMEVPTCHIS